MKKVILVAFASFSVTLVSAQQQTPAVSPSSSPTASSTMPTTAADIEALRQQVQALTETVKALQQQVKDQQAVLERVNGTAVAEKESIPAESSPSSAPSAAPQFPTEDTSVVASNPASAQSTPSAAGGNVAASLGAFPTTDTSVVTSTTPESGLTAPITIGGGKNYMNISFDGMFALAYSSDKHLDRLEVGDHDPQQRGFNARNIELAFNGAVDPYFEGFANIVFKLYNENETEVELEEALLQTT